MDALLEEPAGAASSRPAPGGLPGREAAAFALPPARQVTRALAGIVLVLIVLSLAGQVSKYYLGHPRVKGLVPIFYVDNESNIPTWYSSVAIATSGALAGAIALAKWQQRDAFRGHWLALSGMLVALSADEVAMLHEYPIDPLREALGAGGLLYYTWVLPGLALVALVGVCFLRFLRHLPRRTRWTITCAAAVFVGGAIFIEMLSGWQADRHGEETFLYALIITAEEFCEMAGIVILIHALVDYIHRELGGLRVWVGAAGGGERGG